MHLLLKRNPTIFYQHFIECIFHFTGYEKHESFNRFPQSDRSVPRRGGAEGPGAASPPGTAAPGGWPRGERASSLAEGLC